MDIKVLCYHQNADNQAELSKREKDEILSKLMQAERTLTDWKGRVNKLEEDNSKLRRALEQSMTRLNRMSMDSDFLVDRLGFSENYHPCFAFSLLGISLSFFNFILLFLICFVIEMEIPVP